MDVDFMESVWWVFRQLWDKGLVYKDFKVLPYSWGATTPLSNFEVNLGGYREVDDPSLTVRLEVVEGKGALRPGDVLSDLDDHSLDTSLQPRRGRRRGHRLRRLRRQRTSATGWPGRGWAPTTTSRRSWLPSGAGERTARCHLSPALRLFRRGAGSRRLSGDCRDRGLDRRRNRPRPYGPGLWRGRLRRARQRGSQYPRRPGRLWRAVSPTQCPKSPARTSRWPTRPSSAC